MPRKAARLARRAQRLCVECPTTTLAARCPACKLRERMRERGVAHRQR